MPPKRIREEGSCPPHKFYSPQKAYLYQDRIKPIGDPVKHIWGGQATFAIFASRLCPIGHGFRQNLVINLQFFHINKGLREGIQGGPAGDFQTHPYRFRARRGRLSQA